MSEVFIVTGAWSEDPREDGTHIIGAFSSLQRAEAAMLVQAPESGEIDGAGPELVLWRQWDNKSRGYVTKKAS